VLELLIYWAVTVHQMTPMPGDPGCPDVPDLWDTKDLWTKEEL
jgi:hypothetical protein